MSPHAIARAEGSRISAISSAKRIPPIAEFYRQNHTRQTVAFVLWKEREYGALARGRRGIQEAVDYLNTLVDESDPDTDLSQIEHLLQTSEAIRADGHPRWFILAGFLHDLGKGAVPLWGAAVGGRGRHVPGGLLRDPIRSFSTTFSHRIRIPRCPTIRACAASTCRTAVSKTCTFPGGMTSTFTGSRGSICRRPAQYTLRYHSFYPAHRHTAYTRLMSEHDEEMFTWVRRFNQYDLYSKGAARPRAEELRPFYEDLIAEFFPDKIDW